MDHDNWDGGTYGHDLYLIIPEPLFVAAAKKRESQRSFTKLQNEHIADVFLKIEVAEDHDVRQFLRRHHSSQCGVPETCR
jgi:hypothetical protein